jgi:hypothetical protein
MAKGKIRLGTGKTVKRVVKQGQGGAFKRAHRPERVNLSNTYGIQGSNKGNIDKPGGLKGAVTQGVPKNKHALSKAKSKIRGS